MYILCVYTHYAHVLYLHTCIKYLQQFFFPNIFRQFFIMLVKNYILHQGKNYLLHEIICIILDIFVCKQEKQQTVTEVLHDLCIERKLHQDLRVIEPEYFQAAFHSFCSQKASICWMLKISHEEKVEHLQYYGEFVARVQETTHSSGRFLFFFFFSDQHSADLYDKLKNRLTSL